MVKISPDSNVMSSESKNVLHVDMKCLFMPVDASIVAQ